MKFVVFSDLHYAPVRPVNNGSRIERKLTEYSLPILNRLIEKINNDIKPDLVINCGDLVEDFNDKEQDIINLQFIWNKLQKINADFYSVAGNHDLRSMDSREEVEKIMGYKHSTFSFDKEGYHFVLLGLDVKNITNREEGGIFKTQFISNADLLWLKDDLKKNKKPCLIFNHFGIAEDDMAGNYWFHDCAHCALLGNRKELKEIIENDGNVIGVFSGHQHWTKHLKENGIDYHVVGSLTENVNGTGICDGVYFVVEIENGKTTIKEEHIII